MPTLKHLREQIKRPVLTAAIVLGGGALAVALLRARKNQPESPPFPNGLAAHLPVEAETAAAAAIRAS